MITTQEHTGFIKIEDYGFAEWLAQVEQVIKQGYEFDFVNNENYPVGYGSMYTAVLVPTKEQLNSVLTVQVDTTEVRALIDEKIAEVKAMQPEETTVNKVDGRRKK